MTQPFRLGLARLLDSQRFVPATLGLALVIRLAWIAAASMAGSVPVSDAAWYYARAASIALGDGYAINGLATAYWPVGYPAMLGSLFGIFGIAPVVGMLANAVLGCLAIALLHRALLRLGAARRVANIAVGLLALHPNSIAYSSLLMSEPLFVALMMAHIALLAAERPGNTRVQRAVLGGLLAGAAILVKPQAAAIPLLVLAVQWWPIRREVSMTRVLRTLALVYGSACVVVVPWMIRNAGVFGTFGIISNNDGINLLIGNNPRATGAYMFDDAIEGLYNRGGDEVVWNSRARALALRYLAEHPLAAAARIPKKLWYLYRSDAEGITLNFRAITEQTGRTPRMVMALKLLAQGVWVLLMVTVVAGAIAWWRDRKRQPPATGAHAIVPRLAAAMILYFTVIPLAYFGDARFHFPATPWLVVIAALVVDRFLQQQTAAQAASNVAADGAVAQ